MLIGTKMISSPSQNTLKNDLDFTRNLTYHKNIMSTNNAYTITGSGKIVAFVNGNSYSIETDHQNYFLMLKALEDLKWDSFVELADIKAKCANYIGFNGVEIKDGCLYYLGEQLDNTITKRVMRFMSNGLPFIPIVKFLENLMQNPSKRAVDELYNFLEKGEMPITEDGCFLAFKNVTADYKDIFTKTFDNSIGKTVSMPRWKVCEEKAKTCSEGLHFCSISYLPSYSDTNGGKTIVVKINPKDVVSIPIDYDNAKGRCCSYEVVGDYAEDWRKKLESLKNGWSAYLYLSDGSMFNSYDDESNDEDGECNDEDCGECGDNDEDCGDCCNPS